MTLKHLLNYTGAPDKEALLEALLAVALNVTGDEELNLDLAAPGLAELLRPAVASAEDNMLACKVIVCPEDDRLDDAVLQATDEVSSDTNNMGADEQVRFLIVEAGWEPSAVQSEIDSYDQDEEG